MRKSGVFLAMLAGLSTPAWAADPIGNWLVAEGDAVIKIAPCNGNAYCGSIAWTPEPGTDQNNPDPSKRNNPLVGTEILLSMKPAGDARWDGHIYNAQNGKIYDGHIELMNPNVLRIEGCVLGFLCGGENWTRASVQPATATHRSGGDLSRARAESPVAGASMRSR